VTLTIKINPNAWKRDLFQGLKSASANKKRALGTPLIGLFTFFITVFSANPEYSWQMINSGVQHWPLAFITRFTGLYANTGSVGILLTLAFSALVSVTLTNTVVQLRMNKLDVSSLGAVPGFLAGGCASCGVGVMSLLGFGGVLASMPFEGNILRLGAVLILLALIIRTGNPDTCKI
jgi:hypothetical protein